MSYNWEFTHFYVIPGNEKEFQEYAHNHTSRLSKIGMVPRIVLLEYDLSSDVNPSGVFIGEWWERSDIDDIMLVLLASIRRDEFPMKDDGLQAALRFLHTKRGPTRIDGQVSNQST